MKTLATIILFFLVSTRHLVADSSIVWSGQQNVKMGPGSTIEWLPAFFIWSLDMNSDGVNEITFGYNQWFTAQPSSTTALVMTHPSPSVYDAPPLAAGTSIGATLDNGTLWHTSQSTLVDWEYVPDVGPIGAGSWAFVANAYMGVSFTATDGVHYGWVEITSFSDQRAYIHSWAYESQPGVSITAGVVPEPSTIQLCLVGGLLALCVVWRRGVLVHRRD
jgi:hypothetical protein